VRTRVPPHSAGCSRSTGKFACVLAAKPVVDDFLRRHVADPMLHDDLSQEGLTRLIAAADRIIASNVSAYARVVTRNVVLNYRRDEAHRAQKLARAAAGEALPGPPADEDAGSVDTRALRSAMGQLSAADRTLLEALASEERPAAPTPGMVRVRMLRARARARVHYTVASQPAPPPSGRCVPVLVALATGDRCRQHSIGVHTHIADCAYCARLADEMVCSPPHRGH